jgi:hypothetical protein
VSEIPIIVSQHVAERVKERWPVFKDVDHVVLVKMIVEEVKSAREEGRVAARKPRWVTGESYRTKHPSSRRMRYVWTIDQNRMYVVHVRSNHWWVISAWAGRFHVPERVITTRTGA